MRGWDSSSLYSDELQVEISGFISLQGQDFSLLHVVQNGSEAHPTSCPVGIDESLSLGVKQHGCKADRSPDSSAAV
jgi:hypothetical protein